MSDSNETRADPGGYFSDAYFSIYSRYIHRPAQTLLETDFVLSALDLKKGDALLDLACGFGRHLRIFVRRGICAVGLDQALPYLQHAAESLPARMRISPPLVRADMSRLPFGDKSFKAAVCLFNSFGYADGPDPEKEHQKILSETGRVLKPGGCLFLEIPGRRAVADLVRSHPQTLQCGPGFFIHEMWDYDRGKQILYNWTTFENDSESSTASYRIRLYSLTELKTMLRRSGMNVEKAWSDYEGTPFHPHSSPTLLVKARLKG